MAKKIWGTWQKSSFFSSKRTAFLSSTYLKFFWPFLFWSGFKITLQYVGYDRSQSSIPFPKLTMYFSISALQSWLLCTNMYQIIPPTRFDDFFDRFWNSNESGIWSFRYWEVERLKIWNMEGIQISFLKTAKKISQKYFSLTINPS